MSDIGIKSAVIVDGQDVSDVLNQASTTAPMSVVDRTTFRSPGYARRFNAGLISEMIQTKGFLDNTYDEAVKLLGRTTLQRTNGQQVLIGVGGLDVGNLAIFAKSHKTTTSVELVVDGLVAVSADFQVTAASPGVCKGVTLQSPHGSTALTQNETETLVFTNVPAGQQFAFRKDGTLSATWTAADTNSTLDTRLESLYGSGTLTVTGTLTTSTDGVTGETLYSGTLTLVYAGSAAATDVDQVEVVPGEANRILVASGDSGNYVYDGVTWTLAQSAATIQAAFRGAGGNLAAVNVKGTTIAPASGSSLATGGTPSASSTFSSAVAALAFDGNPASGWTAANAGLPQQLQYDRGAGNDVIVTSFSIIGHAPNDSPRSFEFRGKLNSGDAWTVLSTQTDIDLTNGLRQTFDFVNTTSFRYFDINITAKWGSSEVTVCDLAFYASPSPGSAALGVYYPPALGNVTLPSVTGTGITRSTREQGGGLSTGIVPDTSAQGLSTDAIYNPVTTTGNGTAVMHGTADSTSGAEAVLQSTYAAGAGKSLAGKLQHAPDVAGSPGSWSDLIAFDAITAPGAQRKSIAAGVTIHPHLRFVVTAVTGTHVAAVAFARNQI